MYLEWIDALLKANDPMILKALADKAQAKQFGTAFKKFEKRINELMGEKKYATVTLLGGEVLRKLPGRLSSAQAATLTKRVKEAATLQLAADRARVEQLAAKLQSADAAAVKASAAELKSMGDRAVAPLIEQLRTAVAGNPPNPTAEKVIVGILVQIAPKLDGYDLAAARPERLKKIDQWKKLRS